MGCKGQLGSNNNFGCSLVVPISNARFAQVYLRLEEIFKIDSSTISTFGNIPLFFLAIYSKYVKCYNCILSIVVPLLRPKQYIFVPKAILTKTIKLMTIILKQDLRN
jgi:hypothetical protein